MTRYFSRGKLLLTGEYAVLDGAMALSLPTRFGQNMDIEIRDDAGLFWTSLDSAGEVWFQGEIYQTPSSTITYRGNTSYESIGQRLAVILAAAQKLLPEGATFPFHHTITTKLDFPRAWGLGSSSTLINNIAQWMGVDPYRLLFDTLGGSGYDIACATADGPILYQVLDHNPWSSRVDFDPPFKDSLCFVHLGHKQLSSEGIAHYRWAVQDAPDLIARISSLTKKILACTQLASFERVLETHEELLSKALQLPRVQTRFRDYPGVLKSLGAWGGDFILATQAEEAPEYFKKKGLTTVIPFSKMVL